MNEDHAKRVAELEQTIRDIGRGRAMEPRRWRNAAIYRVLNKMVAEPPRTFKFPYRRPNGIIPSRFYRLPPADDTAVISPKAWAALKAIAPPRR